MMQRWLASVLLYCENGFQRGEGFAMSTAVFTNIESKQANEETLKIAALEKKGVTLILFQLFQL